MGISLVPFLSRGCSRRDFFVTSFGSVFMHSFVDFHYELADHNQMRGSKLIGCKHASSKVTSHRNLFEASLICVVQYQCTLHTQQMQMNGVCALFACQAQLTCRQCTIFLIDLRDYNANSLTNSLGANASFVVLDILECCSYVAKSMAKYLRTATDANEYLAM